MCKYKGKKFTIATVKSSEYVLKEIPWYWTDEMLEPVEIKNCDNCGNRAENFYCKAVNCYMPNLDKWKPIEEKQPEQVMKKQVQRIAKENKKSCDDCKHNGDSFDCSQCYDMDEWEEKETKLSNLRQDFKSILKVEKFEKLQEEELELYKQKKQKYGDSFGISVQKYGLISALTRMSDKWNRIENLILNHDNGTDDESLIDSLKDLSNYANMTVIELENENKPHL